jgi:hypothetical protein
MARATGGGVLVANPIHGMWINSMTRGSVVRFQTIRLTSKGKHLRSVLLSLVVFAELAEEVAIEYGGWGIS